MKQNLLHNGFDELNVIQQIDGLYMRLDANVRKRLLVLFVERYLEMLVYLEREPSDGIMDDAEVLAEMYLSGMLTEPDSVTHYAYDAEVLRKRDRAKEAINAVAGTVQKQQELDKAMRLFAQMYGQYADETSDNAALIAMEQAGVKNVRWNSQKDGRVCKECDDLDGQVFPIDKVPVVPHWRCRCWLSPIIK